MLKIIFKSLSLLSFLSASFAFYSPQIKAVGEVRKCPTKYDAFDAECKCANNQCRLSRLGTANFIDKFNASNYQGAAEFTCYDKGVTIQTTPNSPELIASFDRYKARYFEYNPSSEDAKRNGGGICPATDVLLIKYAPTCIKTTDSITRCDAYDDAGYNIVNLPDENGEKCYEFTFAISKGIETADGENQSDGIEEFQKDGVIVLTSSAEAANELTAWTANSSDYVLQPGTKNRYKICTNDKFTVHRYLGHDDSFNPLRDLKNCNSRDVVYDPSTNKYFDDNVGVIGNDDGSSSPGYIARELPFYVDEFSRLPNNQNIPFGATCVVEERTINDYTQSYAYWQLSETKYFGRQTLEDVCGPDGGNILFSNKDLRGGDVEGVPTAFGCLPGSWNGAVAFAVRLATSIASGVTMLIISINFVKIFAKNTNSDAVAEARKKLVAATGTFIGIIVSLTVLNILGLQILNLASFGGGIFRIFTGG